MKLARVAAHAVVAAVWIGASQPAAAQPFVSPDAWDLSGTWELQPATFPQHFDWAAGCPDYNRAMFGWDRMELELVEVEHTFDSLNMPNDIVFRYRGTYEHRHAEHDVLIDIRNSNFGYVGDPVCGVERLDYELDFVLRLKVSTRPQHRGNFRWTFELDGTPGAEAFGEHTPLLGAPRTTQAFPPLDRPDVWLYQDYFGQILYLPISGGGTASFPTCYRDGPNEFTRVGPRGTTDIFGIYTYRQTSNCGIGWDPRLHIWHRAHGARKPFPGGHIKGRIFDTLPDGTQTTTPIPSGLVRVLQQTERIRPRDANEDESAYEAFLLETAKALKAIDTATVGMDGRFAFSDVPFLVPVQGTRAELAASYLIEISGASADVPGGNDGSDRLDYRTQLVPNVRPTDDPEEEESYYLVGLDGIAAKMELADQLAKFAPGGFRAVEEDVIADLTALAGVPTAEQLEGVRRALWAERAVYQASAHAKVLVQLFVENLARFVGGLVKGYLQSADKERASNALQNAQEGAWNAAMRNGLSSASYMRARENLSRVRSDSDVARYELARTLKLSLKYFVLLPLDAAIVDEEAKAQLGLMEKAGNTMIDILLNGGSFEDGVEATLQLLAGMLHPLVFDNAGMPAWSSLARPHLERSRSLMNTWNRSDRDLYRADRDRVVATITAMNAQMTDYITAASSSEIIGGAFSDAADAFELLSFTPQGRFARDASSLLSRGLTAAAFIGPGIALFGDLPDFMDRAVGEAFGVSMARAVTGDRTGDPIPQYTAGYTDVVAVKDALETETLPMLRAALDADDVDTIVEIATGTAATGLRARLDALDDALARAQIAGQARIQPAGANTFESSLSELGRKALAIDLARVRLDGTIMRMLGGLLTGEFSAASDAGYQAAKKEIDRELSLIWSALVEMAPPLELLEPFYNPGALAYPALMVDLDVRDAAGGRFAASMGQQLTVTARVRSISTQPVANVSALITLSEASGYTISGGSEVVVGNVPAGGEGTATFTIEVTGDPATLLDTSITVTLLESGAAPQTFYVLDGESALGPDPAIADADSDGIPDRLGLSGPDADDDGDGLSNREELFLYFTDARTADSDGDGLDDREELFGGADGWVTNPRARDTDGDGDDDGADGAPTDPLAASGTPPPEPVVRVMAGDFVRLTAEQPYARVAIENAGGGTLFWTAATSDPSRVQVSPPAGLVQVGDGFVTLTLADPGNPPADDAAEVVQLIVADVRGAEPDRQVAGVVLGGGEYQPPPMDGGVAGEDGAVPGADAAMPGADGGTAGADAGTGPMPMPPGEEGGCGCRTEQRGATTWWLLGMGLLLVLRRRR